MAVITVTQASVFAATGSSVGTGVAGVTVARGDCVYLASDGKYDLADANDSEATAVVAGIALNGASDGQPLDFIKAGTLTVGAVATIGLVYYLSQTAGGIDDAVPAQNDWVTTLGIGLTSSTIKVSINVGGVQKP